MIINIIMIWEMKVTGDDEMMMTILMDGVTECGDRAEVSYSHNIQVAKSSL